MRKCPVCGVAQYNDEWHQHLQDEHEIDGSLPNFLFHLEKTTPESPSSQGNGANEE